MTSTAPHGTYARYQQEMKLPGGVSCDACKAARRSWQAAWRKRTGRDQPSGCGCAKGLGWPHADPALARILEDRP